MHQTPYHSTPLRTHDCDLTCDVCSFLSGQHDERTLLGVIGVLDAALARRELFCDELLEVLTHRRCE